MLKNNSKTMLILLLIPSYIAVLIVLIGMQMGSIMWGSFLLFTCTNIISAWLLSYRRNILFNMLGSLFFIVYGWTWFSVLFNPPIHRYSMIHWHTGVYFGAGFMLIGVVLLTYAIWRNRVSNEL